MGVEYTSDDPPEGQFRKINFLRPLEYLVGTYLFWLFSHWGTFGNAVK